MQTEVALEKKMLKKQQKQKKRKEEGESERERERAGEKMLLSALAKYRNQSLITRPLRRWGIWGKDRGGNTEDRREKKCQRRLLLSHSNSNCLEVRALSVRAFE